MDLFNKHNNVASYPSRLIYNSEIGLSGTLHAAPLIGNVQPSISNNLQKRSLESSRRDTDEPELKRQRVQTNDEAEEQFQKLLRETTNLEPQETDNDTDIQAFQNDHLQHEKSADSTQKDVVPKEKCGGDRPRISFKYGVKPIAPATSRDSQPCYVTTSPSKTQRPQAVTTASATRPYQSPYPQVYYSNLPVPRSHPPSIPFSSPTSISSQQDKQNQQTVVETVPPHLRYTNAQHAPHPPVSTIGEHSRDRNPLPPSTTSTASTPQPQSSVISSTVRGIPAPQQKHLPAPSATVPTTSGTQPYPFGPYPSYPDSLPAARSSGPTEKASIAKAIATKRILYVGQQTTTGSANPTSPLPFVSGSTTYAPYSTLQPEFPGFDPILGEIQPAGVRTPQNSFFQQGWGSLGIPALTPLGNLGASNGHPATISTASVSSSPANQYPTLPPQVFETPSRRVLSQMDYRAISEAANNAWAAHNAAIPAPFRTPYPPPQEGDDLRHAAGRIMSSWDQTKTIFLKIDQTSGVNEYVAHDQTAQSIQALITYPIDWDLAFYHSKKLAWYYSDGNRQRPSYQYPIKISFPATGYALTNWFFKQTIYPLPLLAQEPVFPQQGIPDEQTFLVDILICATDLQIPKLQNLALNELDRVRNVSAQMSLTALNHTYNRTTEGSMLRKYLVWQYANRLNEAAVMEPRAKPYYPHEFLHEWVIMLTQMWKSMSGRNDMTINLNLEDFMAQEKKVTWPFGQAKLD
ncbi:hypothetical protein BKA64DRAFT_702255 [Cadophora sp. MPI-SDFR-AT-0126]|nr:hypothetical protein BKA64DRAFT_702255 [Leotiomycetes sp. MPI-SDFR-AT-0126]